MKAFGVDPEHGLDGLPAGRQPGGEERQDRQVPLRRRLRPGDGQRHDGQVHVLLPEQGPPGHGA